MNQREINKRYNDAVKTASRCDEHDEGNSEYWGCMSCLAEKHYAEERKRIIALLEDYRESITVQSASSAGGSWALQNAIALIKGEQK